MSMLEVAQAIFLLIMTQFQRHSLKTSVSVLLFTFSTTPLPLPTSYKNLTNYNIQKLTNQHFYHAPKFIPGLEIGKRLCN